MRVSSDNTIKENVSIPARAGALFWRAWILFWHPPANERKYGLFPFFWLKRKKTNRSFLLKTKKLIKSRFPVFRFVRKAETAFFPRPACVVLSRSQAAKTNLGHSRGQIVFAFPNVPQPFATSGFDRPRILLWMQLALDGRVTHGTASNLWYTKWLLKRI